LGRVAKQKKQDEMGQSSRNYLKIPAKSRKFSGERPGRKSSEREYIRFSFFRKDAIRYIVVPLLDLILMNQSCKRDEILTNS